MENNINIQPFIDKFNIDKWDGNFILLSDKEFDEKFKLKERDLTKIFYCYKLESLEEDGVIKVKCFTFYNSPYVYCFGKNLFKMIERCKVIKRNLNGFKSAQIISCNVVNDFFNKSRNNLIHNLKMIGKKIHQSNNDIFYRLNNNYDYLLDTNLNKVYNKLDRCEIIIHKFEQHSTYGHKYVIRYLVPVRKNFRFNDVSIYLYTIDPYCYREDYDYVRDIFNKGDCKYYKKVAKNYFLSKLLYNNKKEIDDLIDRANNYYDGIIDRIVKLSIKKKK